MPQIGSIIGDTFEQIREQGGKVAKEVVTEVAKTPVNILEGLNPVNPAEVQEKSMKYKQEKDAKLASARSRLHQEVEAMKPRPQPTEEQRIQQGAEMAEKGQTNQAGQMNNQLSSSMTPKKKMEPLALTQKRKDKAPAGAG